MIAAQALRLIAGMNLPAVVLPLAGTIVRLVQGSGTVAITTSASIVAPMAATLGLNYAGGTGMLHWSVYFLVL